MKISKIWIASPTGHAMHHKREYTKKGGRTLCGIRITAGWRAPTGHLPKCKRCAA